MRADDTLADWLHLTQIPQVGGQTQRKLLKAFGLPHNIFSASRGALCEVIGEKLTDLVQAAPPASAIQHALTWAEHPDQHILTLADPAYPPSLLEIADPPTLLYVRGRIDLLNQPALAIVGSRNATPQGESNARAFAAALAAEGLGIVSGLALGIDAAAHRGALDSKGNTIAVIGTGADRLYPARNQALALEIAERGAIISEFPLGTPAAGANFPRRNRIISGLARGVLVIEAAVESGSLITARLAGEQGREVFAIPGSIHSPQARGCHRLIRQGAKLVETAQDVLDELGEFRPAIRAMTPPTENRGSSAATIQEGDIAMQVLSRTGFDPVTFDELSGRTGLTAEALSVILLQLELDGRIAGLPGGRYQRLAK